MYGTRDAGSIWGDGNFVKKRFEVTQSGLTGFSAEDAKVLNILCIERLRLTCKVTR